MKYLLIILLSLSVFNFEAQTMYFPPLTGTTWDNIAPSQLNYCQPSIDELKTYLQNTNSKAFILLKDGKIVFEWYFGNFTQDSLYVWNSAGKTLTAMAVGIAQKEGFLSINDTSSKYLGQGWTSLAPNQEEKITILHQLTMTSGLNHTGDHYCTDPACLVYIAEPGTRWMYHNGPYTLLDGVISAATGVNLNTYVNQKIRTKIGMNGFYYQVGFNNINISNARSMARYGLLLLNKGIWDGTSVLDDPTYFQAMTTSSQNLNPSYGYLTWLNGKGSYMIPSQDIQLTVNSDALPNAPSDTYAALGKNGQIINVVPSENIVFMRMGEHDGASLIGNEYNDSIWVKINQLNCSGFVNEIKLPQLQIYPNPTNQILNIVTEESILDIKLKNIQGECIKIVLDKDKINIENLNPGIYFLTFEFNDETQTVRFVKQ